MNEYLSGSLAWSFIGAIVGYLVCYIQMTFTREAKRMQNEDKESIIQRVRRSIPGWWKENKFIIFFVILGLGMASQQYMFQRDQDSNDRADLAGSSCLVETIEDLFDYLDTRSSLTEESSEITEDTIIALATQIGSSNMEGLREVIQDYQQSQIDLDKGRTATPLPKFPSGRCN